MKTEQDKNDFLARLQHLRAPQLGTPYDDAEARLQAQQDTIIVTPKQSKDEPTEANPER